METHLLSATLGSFVVTFFLEYFFVINDEAFRAFWVFRYFLLSFSVFIVAKYLFGLLFLPLNHKNGIDEVETKVDGGKYMNHYGGSKRFGKMPPVYPNSWFKLLDSSALKIGESRYIGALGQHFAVFRSESGVAYVLDAYCPHLGANLGIGGVVKGECLECPFHGWQFDGCNGSCTHIPYAKSVPSVAKTKSWPTHETNGMILVYYDAENREPTWFPPSIEGINNGSWIFHGRTENFIRAHIQEIPENGADTAHILFLHEPGVWISKFFKHTWDATWRAGEGNESHISFMIVKCTLNFLGKFYIPLSSHEAHIRQVGPGLVYMEFDTFFGKLAMFECVTPYGPLRQRAELTIWGEWKVPRFYPKIVLRQTVGQFERDIPIWSNKTFLDKPLLIKEDGPINKYRRWFTQFYSEHSPTLQSLQQATLEW